MLPSIELRWFYPGNLPEEVSVWFKAGNLGQPLALPEQREDIYLFVAPDCDYMGVKLRHAVTALPNLRGHLANPRGQGRLEVKWRRAQLGTIRFGNLVEGKLEKWGKWFCEDATGESFQPQGVATKSEWIRVKKVRHWRTARDCNVEITQLDINGDSWWSLAFEATGEDRDAIANLQAVGSNILQNYACQQLQVQDSFAYPSWLARSQNAIS